MLFRSGLCKVTSRDRDAVGIALRGADGGDLGPNLRAVRHVVVFEGGRPGVGRRLLVRVEEPPSEIRTAEVLEIHREEGDVSQDITAAQGLVEVQAVEDPDPVVQHEDVVGEEIAVAITRPSRGDAFLEERRSSS